MSESIATPVKDGAGDTLASLSPDKSAPKTRERTGSKSFIKELVAKGRGAREFTSPRFKHSTRFDPCPVMPTDVDPRLVSQDVLKFMYFGVKVCVCVRQFEGHWLCLCAPV